MRHRHCFRLAFAFSAAALASYPVRAQAPATTLEQVAAFDHQATGVAVTEGGRIFVNFPRWTEDSPISVAELAKDGSVKAYPDEGWNAWRNAKKDELDPATHWVCVQSVVADGRGSLWVLDPGAPASEKIVKGAPKLVRIDLATNKVAQTIRFDERVAPQGSYLNDIRFSPDGKWGYLTDSGRGALLAVELASGRISRTLDGASSTQPEPGVVPVIDGKKLLRPDGRAPAFASDGIALSTDGETLYWQALTGKTLYSVPTALLRRRASTQQIEKQVKTEGPIVIADGYWMSRKGQFFVTSPEDNSVKLRGADGKLATIVQDERLRWPDSMAEGPDGAIYVTASHIQDSPWFKPEVGIAVKTQLFRFMPRM